MFVPLREYNTVSPPVQGEMKKRVNFIFFLKKTACHLREACYFTRKDFIVQNEEQALS